MSPLSPAEIREALQLEPHPTCGFVHESFRSAVELPPLPGFDGPRRRGSVLYFMVTPEAQMALHRIAPEQMYHHYCGDPLEVLMLNADGSGRIETVGALEDGYSPQLFIPAGTWHVSRLHAGTAYALLATTEWPAVEPADVEVGDPEALAKSYPEMAKEIAEFAPASDALPLRT